MAKRYNADGSAVGERNKARNEERRRQQYETSLAQRERQLEEEGFGSDDISLLLKDPRSYNRRSIGGSATQRELFKEAERETRDQLKERRFQRRLDQGDPTAVRQLEEEQKQFQVADRMAKRAVRTKWNESYRKAHGLEDTEDDIRALYEKELYKAGGKGAVSQFRDKWGDIVTKRAQRKALEKEANEKLKQTTIRALQNNPAMVVKGLQEGTFDLADNFMRVVDNPNYSKMSKEQRKEQINNLVNTFNGRGAVTLYDVDESDGNMIMRGMRALPDGTKQPFTTVLKRAELEAMSEATGPIRGKEIEKVEKAEETKRKEDLSLRRQLEKEQRSEGRKIEGEQRAEETIITKEQRAEERAKRIAEVNAKIDYEKSLKKASKEVGKRDSKALGDYIGSKKKELTKLIKDIDEDKAKKGSEEKLIEIANEVVFSTIEKLNKDKATEEEKKVAFKEILFDENLKNSFIELMYTRKKGKMTRGQIEAGLKRNAGYSTGGETTEEPQERQGILSKLSEPLTKFMK